ncbi:phage tail protein [Bacillus methanolicus]|uniref:phage tail protein n=1 Tax=Bacillus methanolicus TaxID=1471 RepID=UPI002380B035|nr:tail fiber protein [Bacillus methanolicus]
MPFDQNNLPEWNAPGVEPPQSKKNSGWGPGEKPPGDWFNWFFNKTYNALKSLFTNAQHKEEKGQPNGYASLDENGKVPSNQLSLTKNQVGLGNVDNVKQASKTEFDAHNNDNVRHVTQADKDRWNGALPASSYTANDVLNKIKTVDGSGSGLDADMLDGKDSSAFAQSAFSSVKVGATTVSADSPNDTIEIVAGSNVTVTPDAANDKITIAANVPVSSVNGKTGSVNLSHTDVGAAPATHSHAIADVTGLQTALDSKVPSSDVVTTPAANKILKLDANAKLPASITGNADGNAATASKLQTARTISLSGDVTGSASFDGSANATISATLANSGVTPGTYPKVTVDAKGRVTGGQLLSASDIPSLDWSKITSGKPTTLAGYGITDAIPTSQKGTANGVASLDGNTKVPTSQLPSASTSAAGIVQLNDTTNSTSTSQAATANAVKQANDRAVSAENNAKNASLPRTGDTNVEISVKNALNVSGYRTSNTEVSNANKWTRLCSLRVTAQYGYVVADIDLLSGHDGSATAKFATVYVRLKQKNPMGQSPYCQLVIKTANGLTSNDIKGVVTANSATETILELWAKIPWGYEEIHFYPQNLMTSSGSFTPFELQAFSDTLPTGTQVNADVIFETPNGAQAKANQAETNAKNYFNSQKGVPNGVATLGADGKVPASQLNISMTGSAISITDNGNYYTSADVEGALQEIGQTLNAMRGDLITSVNNILNM